MPSELMDLQGSSPSTFVTEKVCFQNEVGFWKTETLPDCYDGHLRTGGGDSFASSPLDKRMATNSQTAKIVKQPDAPYLIQNIRSEKHLVGAERAVGHSLPRYLDCDLRTRANVNMAFASHFMVGEKVNLMGSQQENGFFSSSLSDLFSRKLRLTSNNALYGHSAGNAAYHYEDEEPFKSLEEIEAQTIGNLLPDDDDLLSGVTDGLDYIAQPLGIDDAEDLDLFSSVGGMDLGEDGTSIGQKDSDFGGANTYCQQGESSVSVSGEPPFREQPSRTLLIRNISSNVEDSELRILFEKYGEIQTLYTGCKHKGFVLISYYDIRAAGNAMKALQNKASRHRRLDIHFSTPKDNPSEKDINKGTLVVFNLDSSVSNDELHQIFGVHGEIKEISQTPNRGHAKFIEFYDVRAAEAALRALNRSDIAGRQIKLEASCSDGARWLTQSIHPELNQDGSGPHLQQSSPSNSLTTGFSVSHGVGTSCVSENGTILASNTATWAPITPFLENAFHNGTSSSVPGILPSLLRMESIRNQSNVAEPGHSQDQLKFEFQGAPNFHPHSVPDYHKCLESGAPCNSSGNVAASFSSKLSDRSENQKLCRVGSHGNSIELDEGVFGLSGNGSCHLTGQHYMWNNSHHRPPQGMMWQNSPAIINGVCTSQRPHQLHAVPRAPSHILNPLLSVNSHHVGSAPSVNPSIWDRQHAYAGKSPESSVFHPGSLGNMRVSSTSKRPLEFVPHNVFPHFGNCMDLPIASKNVALHSHNQRCLMFPARGQMISMMSSFDSPNERSRSRRNEGCSNQADNKKQFELDIDCIMRGEDNRTTLMIKNIPNKYTSKMLLAAIDERHRGTYDFIYLPIDFKNKCNVGYAFINMIDPSLIIPFYQAFNGKKWEKFNSEKVASLAYARIQGKAALVAHFQNSSLMNEDKRCRPILFHTDGPNAGDQVPFPMGANVRSRISKNRASSSSSEENQLDTPPILAHGKESSNGESSMVGSSKDSD